MGSGPDISIIVPCFNAERYLGTCLESLAAQRTPDIEMIFIDDGSTDGTGAILDGFRNTEPRARVYHVSNEGVSAARNRGISLATGRYIAFLDADDALEGNALAALYQTAVRTGAQIISANHTLFDIECGNRVPIEIEPVVQQPSEIVREIIHMHRIYNNIWNKLYASELFADGLRLDERVSIGEDALLNLQLYLHAQRVAHVNEKTYVYRIHSGSAMSSIEHYTEAHKPMLSSMEEILRREHVKELYFRDFLQSAIWLDEKEHGIRDTMSRFNTEIRPLVLNGIDATRIPVRDKGIFRAVRSGSFPWFYYFTRACEKVTGRKWGIRR
ncbi:MAG: glycosyltransferase family 2 protein [Clostridia bacterium]|nr:glycosyltransferase family 2 protein [Clostridia bacterium]